MIVIFEPGEDKDGIPVEKTIEIGIIGNDGEKTPLNSVTTNKPSKLESNYKLEKGESLYKVESYEKEPINGSTKTGTKNIK